MAKKSTERFSDRVENYIKYRPDYPREIIGLMQDEMNLQKSSVIADIGSGTGISTRMFLENGNKAFGVEPNELMLKASEVFLKDFPNFEAVSGTAENTTLPRESVDFIAAAQAFHWFDKREVALEFQRILRDNGYIVLIWNERQLDSTDFLREYEKLLLEFGTDYDKVRHEQITQKVLEEAFQKPFKEAVFENLQTLDYEGLKGRLLSSSYVPTSEHPRFEEMLRNLKTLFEKSAKNDKIQILYNTKVFYTKY